MKVIENMNDEVRCGYKVNAARKRLWACELRLYLRFKEICAKYNLKHFLIYGSALGAMRHNGFIPWDDDMDIGMPRKDFDIFIQKMQSEFKNSGISVTYGIIGDSISPLLRIRDDNTTGIIRGEERRKQSKGAFIEIYVFDDIPDDAVLGKQQLDRVEQLQYELLFKLRKPQLKSKDSFLTFFKTALISSDSLWKRIHMECRRYRGNNINTVLLPIYARTGEVCIPREWTEHIKEVPFENISVCVLENINKQLEITYGDYMSLPPIDERGKYHQTTIFYDPDHAYTSYENSDIPNCFFNGECDELI